MIKKQESCTKLVSTERNAGNVFLEDQSHSVFNRSYESCDSVLSENKSPSNPVAHGTEPKDSSPSSQLQTLDYIKTLSIPLDELYDTESFETYYELMPPLYSTSDTLVLDPNLSYSSLIPTFNLVSWILLILACK